MNIQLPHRSQTRLGHYINDVQSDIGSFSTSPPNLKVKPTGLIVGTAQIPGACCEVVLFRIYNALHIVEILKNLFCPVQRRNRIWLWEVSCSHRCFVLVISHSKHRKLNIIFPRNMKRCFPYNLKLLP